MSADGGRDPKSKEYTAKGGGFQVKPQRGIKCLAPKGGKEAVPTGYVLRAIIPFSVLLVLHVFANFFRVQPYRINAITTCPKVITPIGFPLQLAKLVKNADGGSPFYRPHKFRY